MAMPPVMLNMKLCIKVGWPGQEIVSILVQSVAVSYMTYNHLYSANNTKLPQNIFYSALTLRKSS